MKVSLTAIVFSLFLITGCNSSDEETKTKAKQYVKTETVSYSQGNSTLVFNGKIKEKSLINLSFRVGGPLTEISVKTGDYVQKGQVIAAIDKRDYQIQVQSSKAQFQQLEGEYKRYKALFEEGKLPENTLDKLESGYLMAKAGYERAVNQLNDTELKAPISGYIHEKYTESFQRVGAGQKIVSIIDLSHLEVSISVPENQIIKIQSSLENSLTVKNANLTHLPIQLLSVGEKTEKDGMYKVLFSFKNDSELMVYPGMTAEVLMDFSDENQTISIPSSAVFNTGTTNCVWVYDSKSKSVSKKEIQISKLCSDGRIEIASGLKSNDTVVTAGVNSINEGQIVELIAAPLVTNIGGLL